MRTQEIENYLINNKGFTEGSIGFNNAINEIYELTDAYSTLKSELTLFKNKRFKQVDDNGYEYDDNGRVKKVKLVEL